MPCSPTYSNILHMMFPLSWPQPTFIKGKKLKSAKKDRKKNMVVEWIRESKKAKKNQEKILLTFSPKENELHSDVLHSSTLSL